MDCPTKIPAIRDCISTSFCWSQKCCLKPHSGGCRNWRVQNREAVLMGRQRPEWRCTCVWDLFSWSALLNASAAPVFVHLSFVCCCNRTFIPQVSLKSNLSEFGSFRVQLNTRSFVQAFWPLLQTSVTPTSGCQFGLSILSSLLPGTPILLLPLQLCLSLWCWLVLPGYHENTIFCLFQCAVFPRLN